MNREKITQNILGHLGSITRQFNVRGRYPFMQHALGRSHIEILFLLSEKSPLSIKELSNKLNVTSGAVTQFIDALEAKCLVEKTDNPNDKRSRLVCLTDTANQELSEFKTEYIQVVGGIFDVLNQNELKELETLLGKVKENNSNTT